jgi:hypothetical protein
MDGYKDHKRKFYNSDQADAFGIMQSALNEYRLTRKGRVGEKRGTKNDQLASDLL